jgi:hypothetical protein
MLFVAILVGVFGVYAGWHWKALDRASRDLARYKAGVRAAQKVQSEQLGRAVLFGAAAIVILVVMAHM